MWMGLSGISAGKNMAENDLVKFMMEFCFDPATPVQKADESWVPLSDIKLGDVLAATASNPKPTVTSVFTFDGSKTPMVQIGDVTVSASHYVQYKGHWLFAEDHPDAVPTFSLPVLTCLNVSGHQFIVGRQGLVAADYDEHEDDVTVAETQRLALRALNGSETKEKVVNDYSLGLSPTATIRMKDGSLKQLKDIVLGDSVQNVGAVKGIVHELCPLSVDTPWGPMAAAQLIFHPSSMKWTRVGSLFPVIPVIPVSLKDSELIHIITETTGTLELWKAGSTAFVRDYREVALPEMESAYEDAFTRKNTTMTVECARPTLLVPN